MGRRPYAEPLTGTQRGYLAAFEMHVRLTGTDYEGPTREAMLDWRALVLDEAGVVPEGPGRRPPQYRLVKEPT